MNKIIFTLLLAISIIPIKAQDTISIRVMTFNLRFGERASNRQIAQLIKNYNPDFVALQEVDAGTKRIASPHQNGRNMLSEIASETGMFGVYGKTIDFAGGYYGIGFLSKYPYVKTKKTMLPNPKNAEQRALLEGLFEIGRDTIVFASTHLDHSDEKTRIVQAKTIAGHFRNYGYPVVLGGDFNASKTSGVITTLTNAGWKELTGDSPTYPSKQPEEKLDYILAFPSGQWKAKYMEAIATELSDHYPVITDIIYIKE